jgi:adenylate cyclase
VTTRILFVDDESDLEVLIQQKFRRQIREGSFCFKFAQDGIEALDRLSADGRFDLVVTDLNMPRMDGLSLLERLQETAESPSTIVVSAYGDMSNIRTAMNRGAFDFLTKPIDFADLETTIAKTVRHVESLREAQRRQAAAEQAYASLSRYFWPNLAERLASDDHAVNLAGQRRDVAALFTDIADFTKLAEALEPDRLGELLGTYLTGMTDIVFAHEGTVTKVVGDALHVLFGAPGEQPDHAARAVACALALDDYAQGVREDWQQTGVSLGVTRIGVHVGPAIVGNFGGDRYFDYTAYGDTINIAARLEEANKHLGTRICVSAAVAAKTENFRGRPVGDLMLRGRSQALRAFQPIATDDPRDPATKQYLEAFEKLERGDPDALATFARLVGDCADDQLASFHLKRLLNGETGTEIVIA